MENPSQINSANRVSPVERELSSLRFEIILSGVTNVENSSNRFPKLSDKAVNNFFIGKYGSLPVSTIGNKALGNFSENQSTFDIDQRPTMVENQSTHQPAVPDAEIPPDIWEIRSRAEANSVPMDSMKRAA